MYEQCVIDRFWENVRVMGPTLCWEWQGPKDRQGYGKFWFPERAVAKSSMAHRVAWELTGHDLPPYLPSRIQLDHRFCDNPGCVNPGHLLLTTPRGNNLRGTGAAAKNVRKTHCPQGHPYAGENLKVDTRGDRVCRLCRRAQKQRRQQRKREAQMPSPPRTHFRCGHAMVQENMFYEKGGKCRCRMCLREARARYYATHREAERARVVRWREAKRVHVDI